MDSPLVNFGWIVPGRLAAMARPRPGAGQRLVAAGVGAVLALTEEPPLPELEDTGLTVRHVPIVDFTAPDVETLARCVSFVRDMLEAGKAVAVHCFAGYGRTGTVVAAFLAATGTPPWEAIEQVRTLRPGSIETWSQEEVILAYARSRSADARPGGEER